MKQSLIDITPKMGVRTPVYPGDPPFVVRLTASVAAGDPADVSAVSFSLSWDRRRRIAAAGTVCGSLPCH